MTILTTATFGPHASRRASSWARLEACGPKFLPVLFVLAFAAPAAAAAPPSEAPPRRIFYSDFELGGLEDPTVPEVTDPRYLRDWVQQYPNARHPRFMAAVLPTAAAAEGARYLALPLRGANALLRTTEPVTLLAGQRVRLRALARWAALGAGGRWGIRLVLAGDAATPVVFFEGTGSREAWAPIESDMLVPEGVTSAHLEIWVETVPGTKDGELAVDAVALEMVPRLIWRFGGELRRILESDEHPITISSVGYAADTYELEFTVVDEAGTELVREKKTLLVNDQYPIDYAPRFVWARHGLPRGLYEMVLGVSAQAGWKFEERRRFALTGVPPFARHMASIAWGFEISELDLTPPPWLGVLAPDRLLVDIGAAPDAAASPITLPPWFFGVAGRERAGLIHGERGWSPERVTAVIDPLLGDLHEWFFAEDPARAPAAAAFETLRKNAPYARVGTLYAGGAVPAPGAVAAGSIITAPPLDGPVRAFLDFGPFAQPWAARIDLAGTPPAARAALLARALYALVSRGPSAIYLAQPSDVLMTRDEDGGAVANAGFLAWEFVTGFLSGAEFVAEEALDPETIMLLYRRDGDDYLVALGGGANRELMFPAHDGRATVYGVTGTPVELVAAPEDAGAVRFTVGAEPLLVRGLDLARIRTVGSVRATGEGVGSRGVDQEVRIAMTNFYSAPVRVTLAVEVPPEWEGNWELAPQRLASGAAGEWRVKFRVPPWFGIDGPMTLNGTASIETAAGETITAPLKLAVPLESPLVAIEPLGLSGRDADVRIKNRTDAPLTLSVYLHVRPDGTERTWSDQVLPPQGERTYHIEYAAAGAGAAANNTPGAAPPNELWVGLTFPRQQAYVNRVFPIPRP